LCRPRNNLQFVKGLLTSEANNRSRREKGLFLTLGSEKSTCRKDIRKMFLEEGLGNQLYPAQGVGGARERKMIENISPVAGTPAQKSSASATEAPAKKPDNAPPPVYTAPINPRLRFDAPSGVVVTEFLKDGKDVQSQVPSAAALAYLRAGLQADGLSKQDSTEPSSNG
jgi:hypothetical protein